MPMFRFWASDSKGGVKVADASRQLSPDCADSIARTPRELPTPVSPKKRRPSFLDTGACQAALSPAKRAKDEHAGDLPSPVSASADNERVGTPRERTMALDAEVAAEVIEFHFGLEILMKHDELRLINQELAKCQIALEQLRRCHLIPYPVQCPTPSQMLDISSGKGPALGLSSGGPVPKWAPPFGVVEGPYARHYAKWLIPDPMFDGIEPAAPVLTGTGRVKGAPEARTTRSSILDAAGSGKQRPIRGIAGQRLQALSSGYPLPKDKQSGCILRRSDGVTVKLVCIDCHRWDFSSTQGFINHCRIAHKRDFKSHEEAAVRCGHPVEAGESRAAVGDDSKVSAGAAPGLVHPLARADAMSEQQACMALLSRIRASLDLYKAGKLPSVSSIPGVSTSARSPAGESPPNFVGSADTPFLSRLMQRKKVSGNLQEQVADAKTKVDWDLLSLSGDSDAEETEPGTVDGSATPVQSSAAAAARTPAAMRMPSRAAVSPSQPPAAHRAASKKGHHATSQKSLESQSSELPETPMYEEDMDVDLSPNTMASNNAPSLVSDDGEYDDSDDAASSEDSDSVDTESVSDVAEINIDDDSDAGQDTPRPVRRRRGSNSKAVRLKKDESRHVTFVTPTPVPTNAKGRRKKS
ncbi:uncharacterized protein THITE_2110786 [Thermothielavioides terrestris NRRL 8126]|uniref:AHC1-like C2H2 zinc-finger domain-containing protein n=1 Tax=Thermothielavioides terrestris (strain ATCC 38088 / NRRL 8126) TaxID=578455 RepID=G2QUI5_THETT|nr:uncharacterized protein THITE_2110786 [Thermothielavioides terrestris NRRL 8126]AEO64540.1 hypothetical protein THITE_2110786 [Thermothielavioides terrestris NRRL 8126]